MTETLQETIGTQEIHTVDRPITVAHLMPWSGIGGVEIATLRLAKATKDRFHHVAFCLPDAVALKESFEQLGIETVPYNAPTPSLRHFGNYYKESAVVARQLREAGAQIVHFSDEKAAHHNSLAALLARCKTICHLRVSYPQLSLRSRLCLMPVQSFIFVSKEAMQTFAVSLPAGKARVVYDAVEVPPAHSMESNAAVRSELGIAANAPVVGTVARVSAQKDYFTLADAAAEVLLQYPDTKFLIVGDNSLVELNRLHYEKVVKKLAGLGIEKSFIFTGHRTDVPRLITAMDFCVLSTHREGFPLSILETMAMGKPVIATAVGGIPEIVQPGITGYLHQHQNSKELANAIISLIEDPQKVSRFGSTAREHVLQNYSTSKFADEIAQAYSDVVSR
jgi:glycosyltransferase involved in cell wall biosynthesis